MPIVHLETSLPSSKIPKDFSAKLTQVIADTLEKPASTIVLTVVSGLDITWGGVREPVVGVVVKSAGNLTGEENKKHSKAISDVVAQSLGVASDRLHIHFFDVAPEVIGYKGTTFAEIVGK